MQRKETVASRPHNFKEENVYKTLSRHFITSCFFTLFITGLLLPSVSPALTIGGLVRQPLTLNTDDLARFVQTEVRVTEYTTKGRFDGVFTYKGVSLRTLLEMASVRKELSGFAKSIDLAVVVRDRSGGTTTLSWGEIFYKDYSHAVIAHTAAPVMPTDSTGCGRCHSGTSPHIDALQKLKRRVGLPKLVLTHDLVTDRNLEEIVSIEVKALPPGKGKSQKKDDVPTRFTVKDAQGKSAEIDSLPARSRANVAMKLVGSGRGFHGFKEFSGVPLREVLKSLAITPSHDQVVLVTGADGYRSVFSSGELFLAPSGERIIVSSGGNNTSADPKEGFTLVAPDDLAADRIVNKIVSVELIPLREKPRVYVIGIGCGDTSLLTLQAISAMGKADVFICPADAKDRFSRYLSDKPVLFDPMLNAEWIFRKNHPKLSEADFKTELEKQRAADMAKIHTALKAGRTVALLEYGDPTIYGGWRNWIETEFPGQVEVVAGISSFNAGNVAVEKDPTCKGGSMVLTWPEAMRTNEGMTAAAGAKGDTMVIYMGLRDAKDVASRLARHYPPGTPVHVVYDAGMTDSQRVLKTTVESMAAAISGEKEKQRGLIYVGPCLK